MVSDKPRDGRCGATVSDKVGLEVHDEVLDESFISAPDGDMEQVVIERGAVTEHKEPEYEEVISHLRDGFDVTEVILSRSEASGGDVDAVFSDDDAYRVEIEDDDPYVTNHDTEPQGYCERYEMNNGSGRCPMHGGKAGAPDENQNAVTHGLHAKRSNYYNNMDDEEKVLVEKFVDNWVELSSYNRDDTAIMNELYRIAVDQIRLWNAQDEFEKGFVYDQMADYDIEDGKIYAEQENPANLPYDRLDRTTYSKLRQIGVLDSPEDKQAEATESLAEKFAELGNE